MRVLAVSLMVLLALVQSVSALSIENYELDFHVVGNAVVVSGSIEFPQPTTDVLRLPLPADAKGIDLYVDSERLEPVIEGNNLVVRLQEGRSLKYSFSTRRYLDSTNFVYSFAPAGDISRLGIRLVLPEGAILKDAIADSVFPEPDELTSDGRSIILLWSRQGLKQGDEVAIFTRYQVKRNYGFLLVPSAIALLVAFGLLYYVLLRKKTAMKEKPSLRTVKRRIAEKKPAKEEYDIMKHFKEEEQQIIRVLRQRDGSCEQGTLRVITGFSKATLSRLLSELEERKIIHKEKRGKKNLIFLKEH